MLPAGIWAVPKPAVATPACSSCLSASCRALTSCGSESGSRRAKCSSVDTTAGAACTDTNMRTRSAHTGEW